MSEPRFDKNAIPRGTSQEIDLFVGRLAEQSEVSMTLQVLRGEQDGPTLFVTSCVHGDEVNGIEIVRQIKRNVKLAKLRGTVILVPVVNVFGFIFRSRYLPDRRDLNRSFPGSERGSQAAQLAHILLEEVVAQADFGVDLHTGPMGRFNLPQAWCDLDDPVSRGMAEAFAAPVLLHVPSKAGTLRHAANQRGVPTILFEGGEAMRFDTDCVRAGTEGVIRVMKHLNMLDSAPEAGESTVIRNTKWIRARRAGAFRPGILSGQSIEENGRLGAISDPLGHETFRVRAKVGGLVLSHATSPLVNRGDAIFRIGY